MFYVKIDPYLDAGECRIENSDGEIVYSGSIRKAPMEISGYTAVVSDYDYELLLSISHTAH